MKFTLKMVVYQESIKFKIDDLKFKSINSNQQQIQKCIRKIDSSLRKLPHKIQQRSFIILPRLLSVAMPKYLDKDFFGDPLWPRDFGSDTNRLQDPETHQPSSAKKSTQNQEPNENSCSSVSSLVQPQDHEDLQKSFLAMEQRLLYSSFKHEEITYLEDQKKASDFEEDDLESADRLSQSELCEDSHDKNLIKEAELKFEQEIYGEIFKLHEEIQSQNDEDSSMISESSEEYKPEKTGKSKVCDGFSRKYLLRESKPKIEQKECKIEDQMISELIKESFNVENQEERDELIENIEKSIMKKLGVNGQESEDIENISKQDRKLKKAPKKLATSSQKQNTQKYKILTEVEKEYLVYLSTKKTTSEVARRFNISVNNICRWKKGTKRKVGAGRKIVNMELEEKVIAYVKELIQSGATFTRRQIQFRAKQLSEDVTFKASKGWFERFYTRNIDIFNKSSSYRHK